MRPFQILDLSVPISPNIRETDPTSILYTDHTIGAGQAAALLGLEADDFPESKAWAGEQVTCTTHAGTHVDAPWHYWPTAGGEPARTIDELPLDWFYGHGVLFDFHDKAAGYEVQVADLQEKLTEMGYELQPFDIVLIRCDADKKKFQPDYPAQHVGVSADATRWLIAQGIKVMGTDGWGWDIPLGMQAADYKANPRDGVLWAAHYVGREAEYCQIEKLANLDQIPKPFGFKVACFPIKIEKASAGWARPVAILE